MINKNELREDNFVLFAEDGTMFSVINVEGNGLNVKNQNEETWIELDAFAPVPLSDAMLLAFGFTTEGNGVFTKDGVTLTREKDDSVGYDHNHKFSSVIYYAHMLQNLFFYLGQPLLLDHKYI